MSSKHFPVNYPDNSRRSRGPRLQPLFADALEPCASTQPSPTARQQHRKKPTLLFVKPGSEPKSAPTVVQVSVPVAPIVAPSEEEPPKPRFFSSTRQARALQQAEEAQRRCFDSDSDSRVYEFGTGVTRPEEQNNDKSKGKDDGNSGESDAKFAKRGFGTAELDHEKDNSTSAESDCAESAFAFEACAKFQADGFCAEGAACAFVHAEAGLKYRKAAERLFCGLAERVAETPKCGLAKLLRSADKFEKYLRVFKRIVHRHDKHEPFPAF